MDGYEKIEREHFGNPEEKTGIYAEQEFDLAECNDIVVIEDDAGNDIGCVPILSQVIIERLTDDAVLPAYASEGDSGMDFYSTKTVLLAPGQKALIGLGWLIQIPKHPLHEIGRRWEIQLRGRSGLNLKTELEVKLGTIDNTYTKEIGAIVKNTFDRLIGLDLDYDENTGTVVGGRTEDATKPFVLDLNNQPVGCDELANLGLLDYDGQRFPVGTILIRKGQKIAQMVFNEVVRPLEIVEGKVKQTERGGFGSTGV